MVFRQSLHGGGARSSSTTKHLSEPQEDPTNVLESSIDAGMDPFLLDFGTSVNVNEDLRRVVRGEIQEIDESINVIGSERKKEEFVKRQIHQDLSHSHSEMSDLARSAGDQLENVQVHSSFLNGLQSTLEVDLVIPSGVRSTLATVPQYLEVCQNPGGVNLPSALAEEKNSDPTGVKNQSNKELLKKRSDMLKDVLASIKDCSKDVDDLLAKHESTIGEIKAIQQRIETEALVTALQEKREESKRMEEEFTKHNEKLEAIKLATQKTRSESGENAQRLADLTKELCAQRLDSETRKNALLSKLTAANNKEVELQRQGEKKRLELGEIESEIEHLIKLDEFSKQNAAYLENIDRGRKEKEELLKLRAELASKLSQSRKELAKSLTYKKEAEEQDAVFRGIKSENDKNHDLIAVPGRVELSEIAEKKEKLAKEIEGIHKNSTATAKREKEELESKLKIKRDLLEEQSELEVLVAKTQTKKDNFDQEMSEERENLRREIEESLASTRKLLAAIEARAEAIVQLSKSQEARAMNSIEEATKEVQEQATKEERLLYILETAAGMIEKAKSRVLQVGESFEF